MQNATDAVIEKIIENRLFRKWSRTTIFRLSFLILLRLRIPKLFILGNSEHDICCRFMFHYAGEVSWRLMSTVLAFHHVVKFKKHLSCFWWSHGYTRPRYSVLLPNIEWRRFRRVVELASSAETIDRVPPTLSLSLCFFKNYKFWFKQSRDFEVILFGFVNIKFSERSINSAFFVPCGFRFFLPVGASIKVTWLVQSGSQYFSTVQYLFCIAKLSCSKRIQQSVMSSSQCLGGIVANGFVLFCLSA